MSNALSIIRPSRTAVTGPGMLGRTVFDDVFGSLFDDWPNYVRRSTEGYPVADIYRGDDNSTVLEFALAGFTREDLSIDIQPEKRSITVKAESNIERQEGRRIARRSFQKTYVNYDDDLDLTAAAAKFENGLLTVTVPRRPEVKPVSVKIV